MTVSSYDDLFLLEQLIDVELIMLSDGCFVHYFGNAEMAF